MKGSESNHLIQARKFAQKRGEIRFNWLVKDFSELPGTLYGDSGEVKVVITGRTDLNGHCLLDAEIKANLTLTCQTTFEPVDFDVDTQVTYCTVTDENQLADVADEFDAVVLEDGLFDSKKVIEDELILSVPLAVNKPMTEVKQKMSYGDLDEDAIAAQAVQ